MKKVITVLLIMSIFLTPVNIKAEELQGVAKTNHIEEIKGNMTVTYRSNKVINIDKGNNPYTGDNKMVGLWIITSLSSSLMLLLLLFLKRRQYDDRKEIS